MPLTTDRGQPTALATVTRIENAGEHRMKLLDAKPWRLQAAIVDLDGTMVDTIGDFVVALSGMLADLGLPRVERGFVEGTVGKGSEHLIQRTLAQVGGPAEAFDDAFDRYQRHYLAINGGHSDVFPGVVEGLQRLVDRGMVLACLANKPTALALSLLQKKRLDGFFRCARAAGCPVVLVSYGYNHGEPVRAVDCDAVGDRLDEL